MARDTMRHVSKAKKTLILLANSKPAAAKKIIAKASQNVLKAISELALNMLNGVLTLNDAQKKRMKRHKNSMRRLAEVNSTLSAKKKIIQKGGFLSTLLSVGLPLIIKGVTSLATISKKRQAAKKARILARTKNRNQRR